MSVPKWNSDDIIQFLEIYEKYEGLWDFRHQDYTNKKKRELLFTKLVMELTKCGFENVTVEVIRKKLKTLKTVYSQELTKIANSRRSGAGIEDMYKPKLAWFGTADSFLRCVTATRTYTSTVDMETDLQEEYGEEENVLYQPEVTHSFQRTPGSKRSKYKGVSLVKKATSNVKHVGASSSSSCDEFQQFANHIAVQLRQLPLQNALLLQERIQSMITRERISCLESTSPLHVHIPPSDTQDVSVVYLTSPSNPSTDQSATENQDTLVSLHEEECI